MSYLDIYKKRLNRYGENFQERLQNQREALFDKYLLKSIYRVEFMYDGQLVVGSLEKYKQDTSKTLQYLLTNVDIDFPSGTVLLIPDKDEQLQPYMVYYLEYIKASGYNRYILLKMTHLIKWIKKNGDFYFSWAYLYGPTSNVDNMLSSITAFGENNNKYIFIMPFNENLEKDDYLIVESNKKQQQFKIQGYNIQSTPGVEYVTIDPFYEIDLTPSPTRPEQDLTNDYFWLEGE